MIGRRGLFGLLAAPAIVRVASIMPVSVLPASLDDFTTDKLEWHATERHAHGWMSPDLFRSIVEPALQKAFEDICQRELADGRKWREIVMSKVRS